MAKKKVIAKTVKKAVKEIVINPAAVSTEVVIASMEKEAAPMFKKLSKISTISSKADFDLAAEQVKLLKSIDSMATKEEKSMTDPLETTKKRIKAHFKPFHDKVNEAETNAKLLMSVWLEENDRKMAKIESDFKKGDIKKVSTYTEKLNVLQVANEGSAGKVKQVSKLFINDEKKIPREFLVPDESAIIEAFKNGKTVAGCEYKKVKTIAI